MTDKKHQGCVSRRVFIASWATSYSETQFLRGYEVDAMFSGSARMSPKPWPQTSLFKDEGERVQAKEIH